MENKTQRTGRKITFNPFTARAWFSISRSVQKQLYFEMKIPRYFYGVNCVFQLNDGLSSATKVKGLDRKRVSRNTVFSVIFYKIILFSTVR